MLLVNSSDKSNERGGMGPSSKVSQKQRYVSELPQYKEWKVSVVMILVFSCRSVLALTEIRKWLTQTALQKITALNWNSRWTGESHFFVYNYLGLVYSEEAVGEKAWFMKRSNKTMLSVYFSFIKFFLDETWRYLMYIRVVSHFLKKLASFK